MRHSLRAMVVVTLALVGSGLQLARSVDLVGPGAGDRGPRGGSTLQLSASTGDPDTLSMLELPLASVPAAQPWTFRFSPDEAGGRFDRGLDPADRRSLIRQRQRSRMLSMRP